MLRRHLRLDLCLLLVGVSVGCQHGARMVHARAGGGCTSCSADSGPTYAGGAARAAR